MSEKDLTYAVVRSDTLGNRKAIECVVYSASYAAAYAKWLNSPSESEDGRYVYSVVSAGLPDGFWADLNSRVAGS